MSMILIHFDFIVLSMLSQSAQMASPHLTEEAVYLCTGNPMPKDIEQIAYWLLNESYATSYQSILLNLQMMLLRMLPYFAPITSTSKRLENTYLAFSS